jgi:hypothetical protein
MCFHSIERIEEDGFHGVVGAPLDTPIVKRDRCRLGPLQGHVELQLDGLRARGFTDKHPDIIRNIKEIDEVRATMLSDDTDVLEEEPTNSAQRTTLAQRDRARERVKTVQKEIARLETEREEIEASISGVPRVAEQLEALLRQHRNLTENLRDFNNRRLEAEVQADLERRQLGEQFRVLEPAEAPTEPSSPNRLVILLVGLLLGFSMGVAAAVVAESADSSVHGPQALQSLVGIPVLASIPNIMLAGDIRARRRRWIRNIVATASVAIFCLAGGAATYVAVNGSPIAFPGAAEQDEVPADDEEASGNESASRSSARPGRAG